MTDETRIKEDFLRVFKFSRFEESKTFEEARLEAIQATCSLNGGTIHDHAVIFDNALRDLCLNHRNLWGDDIRAEDNRWFQFFQKQAEK